MARTKNTAGKLSMDDMEAYQQEAGYSVAHNLREGNPTEVKEWIPTGSRWLDSIICRGKLAGIPVGKIVEIAGLEASGKSSWLHRLQQTPRRWVLTLCISTASRQSIRHFWSVQVAIWKIFFMFKLQSVEFVLETI